MKLHIAILLGILPLARAEPEFVGVLSSADVGKLFVVVPSSGAPARWVKIGDEVGGYVVADSRENDDLLILKKGERELALRMKASKVQHADYRGEPLSLAAAKRLIGSLPGWESDVIFDVFRRKDGGPALMAARRVGNIVQIRFVPLTPDSAPPSNGK